MTEIEKLKARAALWQQKADQLVKSVTATATFKADYLKAKGESLFELESVRAAARADKWLDKHQPEKADAAISAGNAAALAKVARWNARADTLIAKETQAAELQARLWRDRAFGLVKEAARLEDEVRAAQERAWQEEVKDNR
jgi:hypothetical protein